MLEHVPKPKRFTGALEYLRGSFDTAGADILARIHRALAQVGG